VIRWLLQPGAKWAAGLFLAPHPGNTWPEESESPLLVTIDTPLRADAHCHPQRDLAPKAMRRVLTACSDQRLEVGSRIITQMPGL
jgi:hypothetical protein